MQTEFLFNSSTVLLCQALLITKA